MGVIADLDTVKSLAINIRSNVPTDRILAFGRIVDSLINGKMAMIFSEWIGIMNTGNYPPTIVDIANLMTAGRLEKTQYAVNEAGKSTPNPYGVSLYKEGLQRLEDIWNGRELLLGLTRLIPVDSDFPEGTFDPVGGLRTQGGGESRLDDDIQYRLGGIG